MKFRVVVIIIFLSLLFFFGFNKVYANKNKEQITNIEHINILKYSPKDSKLLFISNLDSSNFIYNIENNKNSKNQDNFVLIKDSILDYLGLDLGNNKLKDIYDNELLISTFENNQKRKDDILIVFKIRPEKNLDDILHLSNQIDQSDEITKIQRENKINFLNFIYRTEDNYIIASSDKELVLNCIKNSNNFKEKKFQYQNYIFGINNSKNILFTKNFGKSIFFNNEIFSEQNQDVIATTFTLKDKQLTLKSYLLNNKKNIDIFSYKNLIDKENSNKNDSQVSIFSDLKSIGKYLKPLINDFEAMFFEELNQKIDQDVLILNTKKDWSITFERNAENQLDLNNIKKIKDFNKYSLRQNDNIYSIYSKDILEEKDNVVKKLTYENIYSVESDGLQIISNYLIEGKKLETISKKFLNLKNQKDKSSFLYSKVDIKDDNSNNIEYLSDLEDLNFLIGNLLTLSNEDYLEIIRQSIPEKNPIIYKESTYKIL
jgi:hypothetical protein